MYLRDSIPARPRRGEPAADAMPADAGKVQAVQVKLELVNRELSTPQDVESLLVELRERLMAQLKNDVRIRQL